MKWKWGFIKTPVNQEHLSAVSSGRGCRRKMLLDLRDVTGLLGASRALSSCEFGME